MATAISVTGLSKKYELHHIARPRYGTLGETVTAGVRSAAGSLLGRSGPQAKAAEYEDFWALKDVNFKLAQGERLGIIGRNGAGKSTLLKLISRVTEPTHG